MDPLLSVLKQFMKKEQLEISKNGRLIYKGYELDPIFYHIKDVPWKNFLSLHFKKEEYTTDSPDAEKKRQNAVCRMVYGARRCLKLAQNDLIHIANSERQSDGRCHMHVLVTSKEKIVVDSYHLLDAIKDHAPWGELSIPCESAEENAFQVVYDSIGVAAYYSKINKNTMEARKEYIPPHVIKYLRTTSTKERSLSY